MEEFERNYRILDTTSHINNLIFPQKRFTIANRGFQTVAFLCAALACSHAVVLSGYDGGHGLSYSDYTDLDGYIGSAGYNGYKVLPTVAVPVHAVSAAPLHVDASLDHGYKHHTEQDHDYYVSTSFCVFFFGGLWYSPLSLTAESTYLDSRVKIFRNVSLKFLGEFKSIKIVWNCFHKSSAT